MPKRLIVEGGTLLPFTARRKIVQDAAVVVEDGVIVEITTGKHHGGALDASGRLVMPGLINAHTHLYQVLLRGMWDNLPLLPWLKNIYETAEVLTPEDCYWGALLGCLESIASGVTTVCDHFFLNPTRDHIESCIRGMRQARVRSVVARAIMDSGSLPPDCVKEKPGDALEHVRQLKVRHAGSDPRAMFGLLVGPNTPPLNASADVVGRVAKFATENHMRTSTHVAESRAILEQCQQEHGCGVVEYVDSLGLVKSNAVLAHCVHISPSEIDIIAKRGASVAHNPVSNCMLGDGIAPVNAMLEASVNVALGTDGAASNHTQDMFQAIKTTSLLQRVQSGRPDVLDPYQVLHMATAGGAQALGIDHVVGTIEVGKRADIIVLNPFSAPRGAAMHDVFSHIVHTLQSSDVETTIVDGEILMQDRQVLGQEVGQIIRTCQDQGVDLRRRINRNQAGAQGG